MRKVRQRNNSGDVITGRAANFNRRHTRMKLGDHLIQCDVTGQVCFRSEASMTWRGLLVSNQNWDPRHPQLDIEITGDEDMSVTDPRPFKGEDQAQNSDVVDTGLVVISNVDEDVGASGYFTFQSNGVLDLNGTLITNEWWNQGAVDGLGNFYQIRISRSTQSGDVSSITGITGQFNALAQDRSVDVTFAGVGSVTFYVEIKDILDNDIDSATIILRRTV